MQYKIFNIPIGADDRLLEEMNSFLRQNRIVDIRKELATVDGNSIWTFCVNYLLPMGSGEPEGPRHGGTKIDYKEILVPEVFERFSQLRKCRKSIAEDDAVPAYAVFTDAELSELAKMPELTLQDMLKIPGIRKKKVEKYGQALISAISATANETGGIPDGTDRQS